MTSVSLSHSPSWFSSLAGLFSFKTKTATVADPFESHTARDLIDAANIEPEARILAVQRLPAAHQTAPSIAEARAIEIVEANISARAEKLTAQTQNIRERLAEIPDPRDDRNMPHLAEHVHNLIMDVFYKFTPVIRATIAKERKIKAEYEAWRDEHKLSRREPVYPVSRVFTFAVIAVLLLLEASGNSILFFNASDNGWLGAYATALLIAGVNVGLSVLAGYVPCRYLNHIDTRHHYWAIPGLVVCVMLVSINNLYAGHYRDLATAAPDTTFDEFKVAADLLADPFALSPTSYALLIGGLLCALVAGRKGYAASDPYPGYEPQHRRYVETIEDVEYLKEEVHGGLESIRKAEIVYAMDKPLAARALIEGIAKSYAVLSIDYDRMRDFDAGDIKALTTAVRRFRDLNLQIRTDGIVPAYFKQPPDFSQLLQQGQTGFGLAQLIDAATDRHRQHTTDFQKLISRLLRQIETAKEKAETIMRAIEASCVDEAALPKLSEIRAVLETEITVQKDGVT